VCLCGEGGSGQAATEHLLRCAVLESLLQLSGLNHTGRRQRKLLHSKSASVCVWGGGGGGAQAVTEQMFQCAVLENLLELGALTREEHRLGPGQTPASI
jgi:hypothetical protein